MKYLVLAALMGACASGAAQAQHAYIGAGIAVTDHAPRLYDPTYKPSAKLFGGYELDQTWAIEAGYTDLRRNSDLYVYQGSYPNGTVAQAEVDGSRTYIAAKASVPINEQLSLYGKLGLGHSRLDIHAGAQSEDTSKNEAYGALGVQYKLNAKVALIGEYERYGKTKYIGPEANTFTIGAKFAF